MMTSASPFCSLVPLTLLAGAFLFFGSSAALAADGCGMRPTTPQPLSGPQQCSKCEFHLLPGQLVPNDWHKYTIHSDLPEPFSTPGVLYSTEDVLPPMRTNDDVPIPRSMRLQKKNGFDTIDDDFEVFLFHISRPGDGSTPRRLAVYAENRGEGKVRLAPRQVMVTDGLIGTVHEMESELGKRVLGRSGPWDKPAGEVVELVPGEGKVIAYSKQFSAPRNTDDMSANVNCFGIVRAAVVPMDDKPTDLVVYTLGIPGGPPENVNAVAKEYLEAGAKSAETYIDLLSEPTGCQLRRVIGVYESFAWRADPMTLALNELPAEGIRFQMAAAQMQTTGCPDAGQTQDMLLYPPYVRPETIGNFMTEYRVPITIVNQNQTAPQAFDLRFGKGDADVGLVWEGNVETHLDGNTAGINIPLQTGWAGPKQEQDLPTDQRSFLAEPVVLQPCGKAQVNLRFMVLGNSSLPFQIGVHPVAAEAAGM